MIGASGMLAACTRPLREILCAIACSSPSMAAPAAARLGGRGRTGFLLSVGGAAAVDSRRQVGLRQPEVPLGFDGGPHCGDPLPCLDQKREHVDLHAAE